MHLASATTSPFLLTYVVRNERIMSVGRGRVGVSGEVNSGRSGHAAAAAALTDDEYDFDKNVQINRSDRLFVLFVSKSCAEGYNDGDVKRGDQDEPVKGCLEGSIMGQDEVRLLQCRCSVLWQSRCVQQVLRGSSIITSATNSCCARLKRRWPLLIRLPQTPSKTSTQCIH